MTEPTEVMRKRLAIRAWRRGTREMDLVLGPFADAHLAAMDAPALAAFEGLLDEDDDALSRWTLGTTPPPDRHAALMDAIRAFAAGRHSR